MDWKNQKVLVTGGNGFLGSYLVGQLREKGCRNIFIPRSDDYDLRSQNDVRRLFDYHQFDIVFNLAANVGGIGYNRANAYSLFYDNAIMGINIIDSSIKRGVKKLIQVGTVCSYPKFTPTPFSEFNFWNGYPEETNAPYGLAKKMLLAQLQAARDQHGFNGIYLLPTNLYGPRDEFNPARSHVIPALIRRCIKAKESNQESLMVWGTGKASRDFLYVLDAAQGLILAAEKYNNSDPVNLGSGHGIKIIVLTHMIQKLVGFEGSIVWDQSYPDGQPRRALDTRMAKDLFGWKALTSLNKGLARTIDWYKESRKDGVDHA